MSNTNQYGYLWLSEIKQLAKKLKNTKPDLSYSKHLDDATNAYAGLRHYHEAIVLHKKHMESLLKRYGSDSVTCGYCDYRYCPDIDEDQKLHENRHLNYEKAISFLGYRPEGYSQREKSKDEAYDGMDADNLSDRVEATLKLFRSHYDRSLEAAIHNGNWKQHPSFEKYVSMVEYSSGLVPEDALGVIRSRYGRNENDIPKGQTYWNP